MPPATPQQVFAEAFAGELFEPDTGGFEGQLSPVTPPLLFSQLLQAGQEVPVTSPGALRNPLGQGMPEHVTRHRGRSPPGGFQGVFGQPTVRSRSPSVRGASAGQPPARPRPARLVSPPGGPRAKTVHDPLHTAAAAEPADILQPVSKAAAPFLEPEQPGPVRPAVPLAQQGAGDTPTGQAAMGSAASAAGLEQSAGALAMPMDVDVGQAASGSAASAAAPDPLWAQWQTGQAFQPGLQMPFGQPPEPQAGAQAVVSAPEYIPGRHPGYKLFVGDLPPTCENKDFERWLRADPDLRECLPHIVDSQVSGGARSGLKKCIITFRTPDSLLKAHKAIWRWWAPCDPAIEAKGWRFFGVRVMTAAMRK